MEFEAFSLFLVSQAFWQWESRHGATSDRRRMNTLVLLSEVAKPLH